MLPKKIICLLAITGALLVIFNAINPLLLWDENAYLGNARSHLAGSSYTESFRFPLLEWIISAVWLFTGESILAAKLTLIILSLMTVILVYLISEKIFPKNALMIASLYAFSYAFLYWGFRIYTEIPMLLFILISFYLFLEGKIAFSGIFAGLAFLAKFPSALFAISIALILLQRKGMKKAALFSLFFCIPLIPWLMSNYAYHGNLLWDFIEQYKIVKMYTSSQPWYFGIRSLIYALGPISLFLPIGIYSALKGKKLGLMMLYSFLTAAYVIFFVNIKYPRYFFQILPFLIWISFEGADFLKRKTGLKYLINGIILVFIVSGLIAAASHIGAEGYCSKNGAVMQSIDYLKDKAGRNDFIISNHWPYFGYYLNAKVASFWTDNIDEMISTYHPKYIVINNRMGDYVNESIFDPERLVLEKEIKDRCDFRTSVHKVIY